MVSEVDDAAEYGLVMPFVACESNGGHYQDHPFAAAYSAANPDETLRHLAPLRTNGLPAATVERYVSPHLVAQLDLIAMRHGFTLASEPWDEHPDEWTHAVFSLGPS